MNMCMFTLYLWFFHGEPTSPFFQQENDRQKQGKITIEEFRAIYRSITHREEIIEIFNTYSENRKILSENSLTEFLTQEQYELETNYSASTEIIQKYEPIDESKFCFQLKLTAYLYVKCSCKL